MKRITLALLACALSLPLWAQGLPQGQKTYSGTVELGMTIAELASLAQRGDAGLAQLQGRAFLILGTLAKPAVDEEAQPLSATAAFQQGVWEGNAAVRLVMVELRFQGDQFAGFLETARGVKAMALVDSPRLIDMPGVGLVISFRVLSVQATE